MKKILKVKRGNTHIGLSRNHYTVPNFIGFKPDADDKKRMKNISDTIGTKRHTEIIRQAIKRMEDSL